MKPNSSVSVIWDLSMRLGNFEKLRSLSSIGWNLKQCFMCSFSLSLLKYAKDDVGWYTCKMIYDNYLIYLVYFVRAKFLHKYMWNPSLFCYHLWIQGCFVCEIPLQVAVSTFIVQHCYLLCNGVRTAVGFPVNVKFFLADMMCTALPRKSWVAASFLLGLMVVLGVYKHVSSHMHKNISF